jgi:Fur family peroxide stress response transcriptional regulator
MAGAETRETRRRSTQQLAVVLAAVRDSGRAHPSAETIFARVRDRLPRISLGTVYRNLQRLVDEGAIGMAQLGDRVVRYDPTPSPHDHFVCLDCGHVDDLVAGVPEGGIRAARQAGHAPTSHALVVYGRCRGCQSA